MFPENDSTQLKPADKEMTFILFEEGNPLGLCLSLCLSFRGFSGADEEFSTEICHQRHNSLPDWWSWFY